MNPLSLIRWRTLVVVLALVLLEVGLGRIGGYGRLVVQERERFVGWRMLPDQDKWSRDGKVPERTNSAGFRDEEWGEPGVDARGDGVRDPDVFRVAVVGNSMTYGTSVPVELTWTQVLEDLLQAELERRGDPRRAEVMNFATQGYVQEQMIRGYEVNARHVPDGIRWVCERPGADPEQECPDPLYSVPVYEPRPWWRPDVTIVPTIPHDITPMTPGPSDPDYVFRTLVIRTATYDWLVRHVIDRWIPPPPGPPHPLLEELAAVETSIKKEPYAKQNEVHWRRAQERMDDLRREVEADGGTLMLLNLPLIHGLRNPEAPTTSVYWGPWARDFGEREDGTPRVLHWEPMGAFRRAMERLVPYLNDGGIVPDPDGGGLVIRPDTPFAEDSVVLLEDVGHYSVKGHRLLAEQAFEALLRARRLEPRESP